MVRLANFTAKELDVLVTAVEANPDLANGVFGKTIKNLTDRKIAWTKIAELVNSVGEGGRSSHGMRQKWSDLKLITKKKFVEIKNYKGKSGESPPKPLTKLEERILNMIKPTKSVTSMSHDSSEDEPTNQSEASVRNSETDDLYLEMLPSKTGQKRSPISENILTVAAKFVIEGRLSIREAAEEFFIPKSTLARHVKNHKMSGYDLCPSTSYEQVSDDLCPSTSCEQVSDDQMEIDTWLLSEDGSGKSLSILKHMRSRKDTKIQNKILKDFKTQNDVSEKLSDIKALLQESVNLQKEMVKNQKVQLALLSKIANVKLVFAE